MNSTTKHITTELADGTDTKGPLTGHRSSPLAVNNCGPDFKNGPSLCDDTIGAPPLDLHDAETYEAEVERRHVIPPYGVRMREPTDAWTPDSATLTIMDAWEAGR